MFLGLIVYYSKGQRLAYVVLSGIALVGAVMTSYTRARAESLIPLCKVGFMERPERMVLMILGTLTDRMAPILWVDRLLLQSNCGSQNCVHLERNFEIEGPCLLPLERPHPHCVLFFPCRPLLV